MARFSSPKLLVYIPTYNRVAMALNQLDTLRMQIGNNSNVRVVISDNGSSIGDPDEIRRWCDENSQFEFRQNPFNVGAEAHFLLGFCQAEPTEYIWILADDTPLASKAIDYLMKNLDSGSDFVAMAPKSQLERPDEYSLAKTGLGHAVNHYQWGLISSVVYNMKFIRESILEGFRLHNSSYAHLAILFKALQTKECATITWLDTERLHGENWVDPASDYSLALAGSPLLYTLAPNWETKTLARSYLWQNGGAFVQAGARHPVVFKQTKQLLFEYGGFPARLGYLSGVLEVSLRKSKLGRRIDAFIEEHPQLLELIIKTRRLPFRIK